VAFLLDTNTIIYYFKDQGQVAARLLQEHPRDMAVSAITLFELETGLKKSKQEARLRPQLDLFLQPIEVLAFGPVEAAMAAELRVALERTGKPIGPYDLLIAATAVAHELTLVTRNSREFTRVPRLRCADWY
jgi:tRNA(fMet)-specific endonuclease VapC